MARWAPDAAVRLERAARELFAEQGYAATTVPEIAARAGLTTRTFFRYFADKREVLFLRERQFPGIVKELIGQAPSGLSPQQFIRYGFAGVVRGFEAWRPDLIARRSIIRSDDGLIERELLKSRMLARAIEETLDANGMSGADVSFLVSLSVFVFDRALDSWLDQSDPPPLEEVLEATWAKLGSVTQPA